MNEATLSSKKVGELREIAKTFGLKGYEKMRKAELIEALKTEGEAEQDAPEKKEQSTEAADTETSGAEESKAESSGTESREESEKKRGTRVAKGDKVPEQVVPDRDDRYEAEGILDLAEDGFGFLRFNNFLTSDKDIYVCLLYTSPSPRDDQPSRMPSSA